MLELYHFHTFLSTLMLWFFTVFFSLLEKCEHCHRTKLMHETKISIIHPIRNVFILLCVFLYLFASVVPFLCNRYNFFLSSSSLHKRSTWLKFMDEVNENDQSWVVNEKKNRTNERKEGKKTTSNWYVSVNRNVTLTLNDS